MAPESWTVLKIIQWTTGHFQKKGVENPRLESEVLLAHLLGIDRMGLYLNYDRILKEEERTAYREMIQRRMGGEPIAYIVGYKEFWSMRFSVNAECLIPRPETEHLVEEAVRIGRGLRSPLRVLEIGHGCGAVAIALAKGLEGAHIVATDISPGARAVARANAEARQARGESGNLILQLAVGEHAPLARRLTDPHDRRLVAPAKGHLLVDAGGRRVRLPSNEPPRERRLPVEHLRIRGQPGKRFGTGVPESVGVGLRLLVEPAIVLERADPRLRGKLRRRREDPILLHDRREPAVGPLWR